MFCVLGMDCHTNPMEFEEEKYASGALNVNENEAKALPMSTQVTWIVFSVFVCHIGMAVRPFVVLCGCECYCGSSFSLDVINVVMVSFPFLIYSFSTSLALALGHLCLLHMIAFAIAIVVAIAIAIGLCFVSTRIPRLWQTWC